MNTHPLQFFKDLVENKYRIKEIENKFFSVTILHAEEGNSFSIALEENRGEGYYILDNSFLDIDLPNKRIYFKDHLDGICQKEKLAFLNSLDIHILNEKDSKSANEYLLKILFEVNYLMAASKDKEYLEKYPVIIETIKAIKNHLHLKYGLSDNLNIVSNKKGINPKIQWLGKTNVLTTLFYDLLNGIKSENIQPLIKATTKDIEKLIVENFIDQDGNEFQMESTIKDYLKPSKQSSKRAKGEISIDIARH